MYQNVSKATLTKLIFWSFLATLGIQIELKLDFRNSHGHLERWEFQCGRWRYLKPK